MKKITSILLSLMMVMCFMPSLSFADDAPVSLDGATITLSNESTTYNGSDQKPSVTSIILSGGAIVSGDDIDTNFDIEYSKDAFATTVSEIVNAGTYNVKAKAKSATYTGETGSKEFTINRVELTKVNCDAINIDVNGELTKGAIVLSLGNITVPADAYDIGIVPTHSLPGTYYVTLTATSSAVNFVGSKEISFKTGTNIACCSVSTSSAQTFEYDGDFKTLSSVTVKNGSTTLTYGKDYSINYNNNIKAGVNTAELVITGSGDYVGQIIIPFSIKAKNLFNAVTFENLGNVATGVDPNPKITVGSKTLVKNIDYDYNWVESGKSIIVTITGKGNYTGTVSKTYVTGKSIGDSNTDISIYPTSVEYTGYSAKPTLITVKYKGIKLTENIDYTLSYSNNINVNYVAQVTINGIGSYGGKKTTYFTITPRYIKSTEITLGTKTYTYDGTAKTPSVSVYSGGRTLTANVDYTVSYLSNTNPGTATVSVSGKGNYTGTATATFTITGTDISKCTGTLSQSSYSYTGYACSPTVIVKNGTKTLSNGTDYTVTYKNNIYTGTATAVVTGKNSYSGTLNLNYTINGKANTILVDRTSYDKYKNSYPFKITPTSAGDETGFSFVSSDLTVAQVSATGVVTIVGTGKTVITISTVGNKAYNPASETVTVTVKPLKATPKLYTTSKGKLKVRVTKATGVTKYQIRYGRAGSYKYYYMSYANNSFTTQSKTFSKLKSGYKYYVKVRPYKLASDGTKVYGNWSSTKSIRIK